MKKFTKLICLIALSFLSFETQAQTNVSGGILSNTTWALAGSPYIVTDTIVVFPGVTLTVQPGVTVKFNAAKLIQLKQSRMIANGTSAQPILFTSNGALTASAWNTIMMMGSGTTMNSF